MNIFPQKSTMQENDFKKCSKCKNIYILLSKELIDGIVPSIVDPKNVVDSMDLPIYTLVEQLDG